MKRRLIYLAIVATPSLLLMAGCHSKDYNSESGTTSSETVATPGTTQPMMPDTTHMMSTTDTSTSAAATNAAATKTGTPSTARKGKVTTVMMTVNNKNSPMNLDKAGYYSNVEVLPMFPGGKNALDNFINTNIEYPESANNSGIEGKVTVNFAVDEMGKVSNPKIVGKPLGYGLEEEVLKAVSKMPTWTPGVIKGKNVKTYYTLPVNFMMEH